MVNQSLCIFLSAKLEIKYRPPGVQYNNSLAPLEERVQLEGNALSTTYITGNQEEQVSKSEIIITGEVLTATWNSLS